MPRLAAVLCCALLVYLTAGMESSMLRSSSDESGESDHEDRARPRRTRSAPATSAQKAVKPAPSGEARPHRRHSAPTLSPRTSISRVPSDWSDVDPDGQSVGIHHSGPAIHPYKRCTTPGAFDYEHRAETFKRVALYFHIETCIDGATSQDAFERCLTETGDIDNNLYALNQQLGQQDGGKFKIHYWGARQDIIRIRQHIAAQNAGVAPDGGTPDPGTPDPGTPDRNGQDFHSRNGVFCVLTLRPNHDGQDEGFIFYRGSSPGSVGFSNMVSNIKNKIQGRTEEERHEIKKGSTGDWANDFYINPVVWKPAVLGTHATQPDRDAFEILLHEGFGIMASDQFQLVQDPAILAVQPMQTATYRNICDFVRAVYNGGQALRVVGHSLGGAMAQLNTLLLSTCLTAQERQTFGRIIAITFGSPKVGGDQYAALRRQQRTMHIRMKTSKDPVPQTPRSVPHAPSIMPGDPPGTPAQMTYKHSADESVDFSRIYNVEEDVPGCYSCIPSQPRRWSDESIAHLLGGLTRAGGQHPPRPYNEAIRQINAEIALGKPKEEACAPDVVPEDEWNREL